MDVIYTGNVIAEARKAKGLTQQELAEKLNVTNKAVSKWERGINYPDISLLKPIAKALDISTLKLISDEEVDSEKTLEIASQITDTRKQFFKKDIKQRLWLCTIISMIGFAMMYLINRDFLELERVSYLLEFFCFQSALMSASSLFYMRNL